MTLEQLYYFSEVYRYKSITYASETLHISRQSLSTIIRKLEKELNVQLFIRNINGVISTEAADSLYQSATIILTEQAAIYQNMTQFAASPCSDDTSNSLYVALPESIISLYSETFIEELSKSFPLTTFYLSKVSITNNYSFYKSNDITIYLDVSDLYLKTYSQEKYIAEKIFSAPLYIWVAKNSPLCELEHITASHLQTYPLSVLNNAINISDFSDFLHLKSVTNVYTHKNLEHNILQSMHYTLDFPFLRGKFIYENTFDTKHFALLQTDMIFYHLLIAQNTVPADHIAQIKALYLSLISDSTA